MIKGCVVRRVLFLFYEFCDIRAFAMLVERTDFDAFVAAVEARAAHFDDILRNDALVLKRVITQAFAWVKAIIVESVIGTGFHAFVAIWRAMEGQGRVVSVNVVLDEQFTEDDKTSHVRHDDERIFPLPTDAGLNCPVFFINRCGIDTGTKGFFRQIQDLRELIKSISHDVMIVVTLRETCGVGRAGVIVIKGDADD